jgi:hypothetical protein
LPAGRYEIEIASSTTRIATRDDPACVVKKKRR